MTSWEDTEHPVVLFYSSGYGGGIEGVDLLSLNARYSHRYMERDLRTCLEQQGIDFASAFSDESILQNPSFS